MKQMNLFPVDRSTSWVLAFRAVHQKAEKIEKHNEFDS